MVTKLRRFTRSNITKVCVFLLIVATTGSCIMNLYKLTIQNPDGEVLLYNKYVESSSYRYDVYDALSYIYNLVNVNEDKESESYEREMAEHDWSGRGQYFFYHATNGIDTYKNAEIDQIKQADMLIIYENGRWKYTGNYDLMHREDLRDYTIYLAIKDQYIEGKQVEWKTERDQLWPQVIFLIINGIFIILFIIYLIAVAGRRWEDDEIHLSKYMDRIYTDILIMLSVVITAFWIEGARDFRFHVDYYNYPASRWTVLGLGIYTTLVLTTGGVVMLSLIRKLKAGILLRHSLCHTVIKKVLDFIRSFFDGRRFLQDPLTKSLERRQVIYVGYSVLMVFLSTISLAAANAFFFLVWVIFELLGTYFYFTENRKIYIKINQGFNASLEEQMKSERMKVELISNVSHDLKTPLTSIIGYVDLLSKEELPESAANYVTILADKSERLKNIVSDLFDLAKSTSGNLPMNLEKLDLKRLVNQTLGDMEDEIEKSGFIMRTNLPENPVFIYSDGKRLYRVLQNIISNALKYSLKETRIFIDMRPDDNQIYLSVKNTAAYEMEFTVDEILQRFNRGDKSRSTEGSGLGLSIAESFTEACGGRFNLEIDGDQFKITLSFPMVPQE